MALGVERAVRELLEAMEDLRDGRGGRLSVAVVSTAKYFAPRLIAAFVAELSRASSSVPAIGNRDETMAMLRAQEADVALAGRPPADIAGRESADRAAPLCHHRAARAPARRRRRRLKRDALAGEAFLFREVGSGTRSLFEYFLGDTRVRQATARHRARLQRDDQAGGDGGARRRADLGAHDRRRVADGRLVDSRCRGVCRSSGNGSCFIAPTGRCLPPPARSTISHRRGGEFLPAAHRVGDVPDPAASGGIFDLHADSALSLK